MDTLIKNGTVVTAAGISKADVAVEGGKIALIGADLKAAGARIIDASECYVIPGGVDVHTHLDTPGFDTVTADDFESGTRGAACGGTTTIVDFCQQAHGQSLADALRVWHEKAAGKASIDYGFHIIVRDMNDAVEAELARLPDEGITSFKLFMAYKGMLGVDDLVLIRALEQARKAGALVMVHAENGDAAYFLQRKYVAEGKTAPKYHAPTRPPRVEAEATARAIALAELVGTSIYIVHLTCRESLEEVVRGRSRGVDVLAETCTHYLYVTKEDLDRDGFEGAKYVFTPPARTREDHEILWHALAHRTLELVSSDHASWNYAGDKELGRDDFIKIPNGAPGIEERLTMVYQGVDQGRLRLPQFVDLTATRPAQIFGLFPRKGTIAVGSDADLVIWDPRRERTIRQAELHHAVDYTLYEGMAVRGAPRTVLRRGDLLVKDETFVGRPGTGEFLRREKYRGRNAAPAA
ncbi:MAG TPA: dihydropyrimidinase [Thermomicrobiales bacterium]|nr:dihydropyrimidinase [Thermomicrobiales bacterium]